MEITEGGISGFVSRSVGVEEASTAEATCAVMQMVARLEGVTLLRRQLIAAAAIGASMRVFDDGFDACPLELASQRGADILTAVKSESTGLTLDPRVIRGVGIAHDNFNPTALTALEGLTAAQVDSVEQRRAGTSVDRVRDITRRKGANTALLFALEVSPEMTPSRRNCYEELGFLIQLADDYTDRYVDKADGISTLVTLATSSLEPTLMIARQSRRVKMLFAQEYPHEKLSELFGYIDRMLAAAGLASVV